MKFRKDIRWLLFILLPFISLISIHLLIPLLLTTTSIPLLQQYNYRLRLQQQMTSFMCISNIAALTMQLQINKYSQMITQITEDISSTFSFMNFTISQQQLNKADQFSRWIISQNISLNYTEAEGMVWMNSNSSFSNDSFKQFQIYSAADYLSIIFSINFGLKYPSIIGFYSIIINSNQICYLEYPSRYKKQFSDQKFILNQSLVYSINEKLAFQADNSITMFLESENNNILFCRRFELNNQTLGTICIRINSSSIQQQLQEILSENIGVKQSNSFQISFLALTNNFQLIFTSNDNADYLNQSLALLKDRIDSSILNQSSAQSNQFTFLKNSQFIYYIQPITLSYHSSQVQCVYFIVSWNIFTPINYTNTSIAYTNLIVPIVLLTLISSIISALILKKLMNSIDDELLELDSLCQFIVEGDINVQIPDYFGTKDIKQVYESVKIINKLHRYSTNSYFSGHFADKIFKYNEALQFIRKLNYDPGNLLENIGEAYSYLELFDKSINALKESVNLIIHAIQMEYGTMDQMVKSKQNRRVPYNYKQLEIILIRRLFKLNFTYLRYFEFQKLFDVKKDSINRSNRLFQAKKTKDKLNQSKIFLSIQKKAFFPNYAHYSECILMQLYEAKQYASNNQFNFAIELINRAFALLKIYQHEYVTITKKILDKNPKYKLLRKKSKLTTHSRARPEVLKIFGNYFKSQILLLQYPKIWPIAQVVMQLLFDATKTSNMTFSCGYLAMMSIRTIMKQLQINLNKLESTQIYRQVAPYHSLSYGLQSGQNQQIFIKYPTKTSQGLQREFVFMFDCARQNPKLKLKKNNYQKDKAQYIFQNLVKLKDRISIVKFNTYQGMKIQCNLTFKESNETILKKQLGSFLLQKGLLKNPQKQINQSIRKIIWRIRQLTSEKIILIFFKELNYYKQNRNKSRKRSQQSDPTSKQSNFLFNSENFNTFGDKLIELMTTKDLRNCKICLFCAKDDKLQQFIQVFNLTDINRRIWSHNSGYNVHNNLVYIIHQQFFSDIDRILKLKSQDIADNHIFIL